MRKTSLYEKKFKVLLSEDNYELMKQSMGGTFRDFMNSLVGKTRRQIFDAGSFAFLYSGNKYGMTNAAFDTKNPEVLIAKFLQNLGNYLNKGLERPRIYETEEFKKKYDYYGEHKRLERERMELGKKAINAPEGPEKDAARSKFYQFENNGKYLTARREAIDKEDKEVEKFHNAPLKLEDLQNDGSGDYTQLGLMYQKILRMRKGLNEKLDPKKHDAGDYVKDFAKSKAPQFKGKSKKKKREMAIAAYLDAKDESQELPGLYRDRHGFPSAPGATHDTSPDGRPLSGIMKIAEPYIKDLVDRGITDPKQIYYILTNTYAVDGIPHHLEDNPYFIKRLTTRVAELTGKTPKSGLTDSPYDPIDENVKVRKNKQGLMGSKTRVHKDKKKEASKKEGRKKVKEEDDNSVGGGALGPAAAIGNTQGDFYAPGDARIPKALGAVQTRSGSVGKRRRKRRKKK